MSLQSARNPLISLFIVLFSLMGLAACGGPEAGAEKAARQWLDAVNDGNISAAQEISTESTKAMLQMGSAMGQSMAVGKYKIKEVTLANENSARVTVEAEKEADNMELDLVRVDGKWKVGVKK
jgi:hypothetical protein